METVESIQYKRHTINIHYEENPIDSIGEWDMLGEFVCFDSKYDFGNSNRFSSSEEVRKYAKETNSLLYNLYLFDHGGITISLSPFSCPWDSGQVGYVLIDRENSLKKYNQKKWSQKLKKKVYDIIANG